MNELGGIMKKTKILTILTTIIMCIITIATIYSLINTYKTQNYKLKYLRSDILSIVVLFVNYMHVSILNLTKR